MNEVQNQILTAIDQLKPEVAAAEGIEISGVEIKRRWVEGRNAGGGFQDAPGVSGGVIKISDIPRSICQRQRSNVEVKLVAGGGTDGESAGDVNQVPTGIGPLGRIDFVDLPEIMAAAVPGFVGGVNGAGAGAGGNRAN